MRWLVLPSLPGETFCKTVPPSAVVTDTLDSSRLENMDPATYPFLRLLCWGSGVTVLCGYISPLLDPEEPPI